MERRTPKRSRLTTHENQDANDQTPTQERYDANTTVKRFKPLPSTTQLDDQAEQHLDDSPSARRRSNLGLPPLTGLLGTHTEGEKPEVLVPLDVDADASDSEGSDSDSDSGEEAADIEDEEAAGTEGKAAERENENIGSSKISPDGKDGSSSKGPPLERTSKHKSVTQPRPTLAHITKEELLQNGCNFSEFLRAEVPECPMPYDPSACSTTRRPTGADFSLATSKRKLELLGVCRDFMDEAAAEVEEKFRPIHLDGSHSWIAAQFGSYHPLFTQKHRSPKTYGEPDIEDLVRNILLRPVLFVLQIWYFLFISDQLSTFGSKSGTEIGKENAKETTERLYEIVENEEHEMTFTIGSSPPLTMPNGKVHKNASENKYKAVPDFTGTSIRNAQAAVKTALLKRGPTHGRALENKFVSVELKTPNAYKVMVYLERLLQKYANTKGSGVWLAFKWPEKGDEVEDSIDKILCQVRKLCSICDESADHIVPDNYPDGSHKGESCRIELLQEDAFLCQGPEEAICRLLLQIL
jgi:hypothetical protein